MLVIKQKFCGVQGRFFKRAPGRRRQGFTVGEMVVVIAVIAILAALITPLAVNVIAQKRINACIEELQVIKKAIVGDPALVEGGTRSSFGFVGDVGALPSDPTGGDGLADLVDNAGTVIYPAWQQDPVTGLWYGWRGPYINEFQDPWGRSYRYNPNTGNPLISAVIWSLGPDGIDGNADDISITIKADEVYSMVGGNTLDLCGAGTACTITINAPDGAIIRTYPIPPLPPITTTADNPIYSTGSTLTIPIGIRRIAYTIGGVPYTRFIYVNNGPNTIVNLRQPGTCPQ